MNRREFTTLIVGTAAASPLAARAQQAERMRRIGVLTNLSANDREGQARITAFLQGMQQLGWTDGRNMRIDTRWAAGNADALRKYAAELAALSPDAILVTGSATVTPMLQATRTVPIVFVNLADPVGAGVVDSLARPGGNATGFTLYEYSTSGKLLELLKQIAPGVTRAAVIRDPAEPSMMGQFAAIQSAASSLGVEIIPINVRGESEIELDIISLARGSNVGLIVVVGSSTTRYRESIISHAAGYRLPAVYPYRALSRYPFEPIQCWPLSLSADMRRREFITLLGGAAATWPLDARAHTGGHRQRLVGCGRTRFMAKGSN